MPAKYIQMSNTLRTAITEGEYKSGSRLPTEQQLMEQFSVSRQTVRNALEILTKEGLIQRRQGSGTVVLEQKQKSEIPADRKGPESYRTLCLVHKLSLPLQPELF